MKQDNKFGGAIAEKLNMDQEHFTDQRTSGAFLTLNQNKRQSWIKALMVGGLCALAMLVAVNVTARNALTMPYHTVPHHPPPPRATLRQRRRYLQVDDEIPIGEQVEQAIQDAMDAGNITSDNPAFVNVSWVPLEDLEDDDEPTDRGVVPKANDGDDDGLDRLWIIVMACAGAAVLCLIAFAYARLRKVEREMQQDEDQEEGNGEQEPTKEDNVVDEAGADTNDEDEDEYEEEEIVVEEPQGNVEDPSDSSLGRFEVTKE